jgi:hypothetical protein
LMPYVERWNGSGFGGRVQRNAKSVKQLFLLKHFIPSRA